MSMGHVRFVPLTRELLNLAVDLERDPLTAEMAEGDGFAARCLVTSLSFAMLDGGILVGAGGLSPQWYGRAEGWWLVSTHASRRHLAIAARYARAFLDKRQRDPMFRRIEIMVRADVPWCDSFAASMDFVFEGDAQSYDASGRDYRRFSRIRKGR